MTTRLHGRPDTAGGERMHPLHQYTGQLDWWELQRGQGKYGAPDKPLKNTHLGIIHPSFNNESVQDRRSLCQFLLITVQRMWLDLCMACHSGL